MIYFLYNSLKLKFEINMQGDKIPNCFCQPCLAHYLFTLILFQPRFAARFSWLGLGVANSETNICLSLSADEFLEIIRNNHWETSEMRCRRKLLRTEFEVDGINGGRELSIALDINWGGTISMALFISQLMHYSLFVHTDTYDNAQCTWLLLTMPTDTSMQLLTTNISYAYEYSIFRRSYRLVTDDWPIILTKN